jgi:hypothetical protein
MKLGEILEPKNKSNDTYTNTPYPKKWWISINITALVDIHISHGGVHVSTLT